jgi:hypothetical protein
VCLGRIWSVTSGSTWRVGRRMWRLVNTVDSWPWKETSHSGIQFTSLCDCRISRERTLNSLCEKGLNVGLLFAGVRCGRIWNYERWLGSRGGVMILYCKNVLFIIRSKPRSKENTYRWVSV